MPRRTNSLPKYRKHKASGQAVVTIHGQDHYLGPHGTKASKREYDRLVGEWVASGRPDAPQAANDITIMEVCAAYLRFAKGYYRKDGRPTGAIYSVKAALKPVKELYGHTAAVEFGPLALKAIRARMIEADNSRTYINDAADRIRAMFKWAASEELIPAAVYHALLTVAGLRKGRTVARETAPVLPVDDSVVNTTLDHLTPVVADMVRLQRLTGCRPDEVCSLRPCDVDTSGPVWTYTPESHKTQHHGRQRIICIGPKGQDILRPYLLREKTSYCFSPADSERKRRAEQHASRKTPLSCGNTPGTNRKAKPKRTAGERYTSESYRRAIHRACDKAKLDRWSPNRLRHSAATEIRKRFGLEAAQVTLGHAAADVTQVYAERDLQKAADVMKAIG